MAVLTLVKVSKDFRITIPKDARELLKLSAGDEIVFFTIEDAVGRVCLRKGMWTKETYMNVRVWITQEYSLECHSFNIRIVNSQSKARWLKLNVSKNVYNDVTNFVSTKDCLTRVDTGQALIFIGKQRQTNLKNITFLNKSSYRAFLFFRKKILAFSADTKTFLKQWSIMS